MEQNFNTINLEYVKTKKASLLIKIVAVFLMLIFISIPMYEILIQFAPVDTNDWGCIAPSF